MEKSCYTCKYGQPDIEEDSLRCYNQEIIKSLDVNVEKSNDGKLYFFIDEMFCCSRFKETLEYYEDEIIKGFQDASVFGIGVIKVENKWRGCDATEDTCLCIKCSCLRNCDRCKECDDFKETHNVEYCDSYEL